MNEKSRARKDRGLEMDEVFKRLRLLKNQYAMEGKAIDDLHMKIAEVVQHVSSSVGGAHLIEGIRHQTNLVEQMKHQQLQTLDELKIETFTFLGIPYVDEGERRSEPKNVMKSKAGIDSRTKSGTYSAVEERSRGFSKEKQVEKDRKIAELTEMVEVYATIVSNHDSEQKKRNEEEISLRQVNHSPSVNTVDELVMKMESVQKENKKLESRIQLVKEENRRIKKAKDSAERRVKEVELMLLRASQWHRAVSHEFPSTASDISSIKGSIRESFSHNSVPLERVRAKIVSPESWIGESNRIDANRSVSSMDSSRFRTAPRSVNPLFSELRTLSPIRLNNPTSQERRLLHRIGLYETKLAELEQYEIDRKRCFEEMEKTRAELFTSMNTELEKRKYTIHSLSMERNSLQQAVSMSRQSSIIGVTERSIDTSALPSLTQRSCNDVVNRAVSPITKNEGVASCSFLLAFCALMQEENDSRSGLEYEAFQSFLDIFKRVGQLKVKNVDDNSENGLTTVERVDDHPVELLSRAMVSEKINCSTDAVLSLYGECLGSVRSFFSSRRHPEIDYSLIDEDIQFAVNEIRRLNSWKERSLNVDTKRTP